MKSNKLTKTNQRALTIKVGSNERTAQVQTVWPLNCADAINDHVMHCLQNRRITSESEPTWGHLQKQSALLHNVQKQQLRTSDAFIFRSVSRAPHPAGVAEQNRQVSEATSIVWLSRFYVCAVNERWISSWQFPSFTCGTHLLSLMQHPGRFRPLLQTRECEDYFSLSRSGNMENGWGGCAVLFLILLKLSP